MVYYRAAPAQMQDNKIHLRKASLLSIIEQIRTKCSTTKYLPEKQFYYQILSSSGPNTIIHPRTSQKSKFMIKYRAQNTLFRSRIVRAIARKRTSSGGSSLWILTQCLKFSMGILDWRRESSQAPLVHFFWVWRTSLQTIDPAAIES
jgi:hypothetical protein